MAENTAGATIHRMRVREQVQAEALFESSNRELMALMDKDIGMFTSRCKREHTTGTKLSRSRAPGRCMCITLPVATHSLSYRILPTWTVIR